MLHHRTTPEAEAVRASRRLARRRQGQDVLAERQRLVAFWLKCAETNRHYLPYRGCWLANFAFFQHRWRLLMPGLRARFAAREKARRAQYLEELHAYSKKCAQRKAERLAAKARAAGPQADMFA